MLINCTLANNDADVPRECLTHPWSSWSDCSTKCGEGMQYRRRVYKQPELARIYNCNVPQYEERACDGQDCGLSGDPMRHVEDHDEFNMGLQHQQQDAYQRRAECQLSGWSGWSSCSVTCGEGYQMRQRQYLNPSAELKCQSVRRLELQEMRPCAGRACLGNLNGGDIEVPYDEREPQPEQELERENEQDPEAFDNNNFNRDYDAGETDEGRRLDGFDVGNLKGSEGKINYGQAPRLEDVERAPWNRRRPSDNIGEYEHRTRYGNKEMSETQVAVEQEEDDQQRRGWNRMNSNKYNRNFNHENIEDETDDDANLAKRCFQMLRTNQPRCRNQTVVGHFWFYNFCVDECMLFAADPCDRNVNKFSRWEECEECRRSEFQQLQEQRSISHECEMILASQRAQQRNREEQRNSYSSSRRRNNGNRQWG